MDEPKLVYLNKKTNVASYVGLTAHTAAFLAKPCPYAATSSYRELDGDQRYYEFDGVSTWYEQ